MIAFSNNPEQLNRNDLVENHEAKDSHEVTDDQLSAKRKGLLGKAEKDTNELKSRSNVDDMVDALRRKSAGDRVSSDNVEKRVKHQNDLKNVMPLGFMTPDRSVAAAQKEAESANAKKIVKNESPDKSEKKFA
jgi:hypothetical protein